MKLKYSDFPRIDTEPGGKEKIWDIMNTVKKTTAQHVSDYTGMSVNGVIYIMKILERENKITSHMGFVKKNNDKMRRLHRIYELKGENEKNSGSQSAPNKNSIFKNGRIKTANKRRR